MALVAFLVLCACSSEQKELKYRGLSMALPFQTFIDSMQTRGFAVDSAKTDSAFTRVVMANPAEKFRLMLAQRDRHHGRGSAARKSQQRLGLDP